VRFHADARIRAARSEYDNQVIHRAGGTHCTDFVWIAPQLCLVVEYDIVEARIVDRLRWRAGAALLNSTTPIPNPAILLIVALAGRGVINVVLAKTGCRSSIVPAFGRVGGSS